MVLFCYFSVIKLHFVVESFQVKKRKMLHEDINHFGHLESYENSCILLLKPRKKYHLPDIWIPSRLLPNRKEKRDLQSERSLFHTLGHVENFAEVASFSVYSDTDSEEELVDFSNESSDLNIYKYNKIQNIDNAYNTGNKNLLYTACKTSLSSSHSNDLNKAEKLNEFVKESSNISVHDKDDQFEEQYSNISDKILYPLYRHCDDDQYFNTKLPNGSKVTSSKDYIKKEKKAQKKKVQKAVPLGYFLQNDDDDEDLANKRPEVDLFYESIINECGQPPEHQVNMCSVSDFPMLSTNSDYPKFVKEEIKFEQEENPNLNIKAVANTLSGHSLFSDPIRTESNHNQIKSLEEENVNEVEEQEQYVKLIMENIPLDVTEEDLLFLISGYGTIDKLYLKCHAKSKTAEIEIYTAHDVDWTIECLDGSRPFGDSPYELKCYKAC